MHAVPWVDYYYYIPSQYTAMIATQIYVGPVEAACTRQSTTWCTTTAATITILLLLIGRTADQTLIQYPDNLMVNREVK